MALVAQTLRNSLVNGWAFFSIAVRPFGLDDYQRNAVHKTHNIRAPRLHAARAGYRKLLGKHKAVIGRVLPVNQGDRWIDLFAIHKFSDGNAVEQVVV